MANPSLQEFVVPPPPASMWWWTVVLGGVLPLGIIGALWWTGQAMHGAFAAILVIPFVLGLLLLATKRRKVTLNHGVLEVRAAGYTQRIAATELDLDRAKVINLHEHTELRPFLKTGGMSMPGFDAGHFRLRAHLAKAFCLLTDRERVLWLPQRDGKSQLLLSLERPQALLDALRSTAR